MFEQLKSDFNHLKHSFKNVYKGWKHRGSIFVKKEEQERRLKICESCPLKSNRKYFYIKREETCGICGCYLKHKTSLIDEMCPDWPSKW